MGHDKRCIPTSSWQQPCELVWNCFPTTSSLRRCTRHPSFLYGSRTGLTTNSIVADDSYLPDKDCGDNDSVTAKDDKQKKMKELLKYLLQQLKTIPVCTHDLWQFVRGS
eukprot:4523675-Amphidinium_carterae.1